MSRFIYIITLLCLLPVTDLRAGNNREKPRVIVTTPSPLPAGGCEGSLSFVVFVSKM
jgi:hypothetical protein